MGRQKLNRYQGTALRRNATRFVRTAKRLQPRSKQLLVLLADVVAMPLALMSALALRYGSLDGLATSPWLFVTTVLSSVPIFVRLGLYRAVIRFLGAQAAVSIATGVFFSTLALVAVSRWVLDDLVPLEVFGIYFALALLYVGTTRFAVRELLRMQTLA